MQVKEHRPALLEVDCGGIVHILQVQEGERVVSDAAGHTNNRRPFEHLKSANHVLSGVPASDTLKVECAAGHNQVTDVVADVLIRKRG